MTRNHASPPDDRIPESRMNPDGNSDSPAPPSTAGNARRVKIYALILVVLAGVGLRLYPSAAFNGLGNDEGLYRDYAVQLGERGLGEYPRIVAEYIEKQRQLPSAVLPPTRFLYIFSAHLWSSLAGTPPINALHDVSTFFSIALFGVAAAFAGRMGGLDFSLGVSLLMAAAPTQVHMSQHALIDGFFAFWAVLSLWLLWESRHAHGRRRLLWLAGLGATMALQVMTKENSFFVFVALLVLAHVAPLLGCGKWSPGLSIAIVAGPASGFLALVALAGGFHAFFETYTLLVEKAYQLEYAIRTGDGPWYRYLVDLLIISPLVTLLAVGAVFRTSRSEQPALFLVIFLAVTYLVMTSVKYGMNLRYTNMWDMPMRYLAVSQVLWLAARFPPRFGGWIAWSILPGVALHQLWLYYVLFVKAPLYELVTGGLLFVLKILK